MTRRPIYDLLLIILFMVVVAMLMRVADGHAEPGLPKCRTAAQIERCEP